MAHRLNSVWTNSEISELSRKQTAEQKAELDALIIRLNLDVQLHKETKELSHREDEWV